MNMLLNLESPVTPAHRAKLAYIYVRQSTAGQVRQHQESTELQYRLVDRAALFGWPKERIEVIDDDLGKSGTSSDSRGGSYKAGWLHRWLWRAAVEAGEFFATYGRAVRRRR